MPASSLRRVADVGSQGSKKPSPATPHSNETIDRGELVLDDIAEPPAAAPGGLRAIPPWVLMGMAACLVGIVFMITFGYVRADMPAESSPPVVVEPPAAPAPQVESTPLPTWTGARRATWASDGSKTIVFTLAATRDLPVWMSRARPALVVRCLYRATDAFVILDTSTSFEQDADRRTVQVQWDDEPLSTQLWGVSEGGRELFAPDGVAFVRRMVNARQLRFGFTPFNASPVTAEFVVQDFDDRASLLASTCGWRLDQPAAQVAKN